jgi:hypothetical protein
VVTTSTTILAFKWPSALIMQLVVSMRHIADLASKSLGADRVPLAESAHKRTRSKESLKRDDVRGKGDSETRNAGRPPFSIHSATPTVMNSPSDP